MGRIYNTTCWLSLYDGLGICLGSVLEAASWKTLPSGRLNDLPGAITLGNHACSGNSGRELTAAPGDTLKHGRPLPSGIRLPGVDSWPQHIKLSDIRQRTPFSPRLCLPPCQIGLLKAFQKVVRVQCESSTGSEHVPGRVRRFCGVKGTWVYLGAVGLALGFAGRG